MENIKNSLPDIVQGNDWSPVNPHKYIYSFFAKDFSKKKVQLAELGHLLCVL